MQFKSSPSTGSEGKNFISLKDQQSVIGIFRGDVFEYYRHWENRNSKPCTGEGCELCARGNKPRFAFRLNFIVREGDKRVAKILERGSKDYKQLKNLNGSYPLDKTVVKITRYGSDMNDTNYVILPEPSIKYDEKMERDLQRVELLNLDPGAQAEEAAPAEVSDANEDVGF